MIEKRIGYIRKAKFGFGGYDDAMIGLSIDLGGDGLGVGDFKGAWSIDRTEHCQWTEDSRLRQLGETCMFLNKLLRESRKSTVLELVGVPVEVTLDGNILVSWRILTEAIPQASR